MFGLAACDDVDEEDTNDQEAVEAGEVEDEADETDKADEEADDESGAAEDASSDDVYGIGDTIEIEGARFTLKDVTTTDERNEFADTDPEHVIAIEYELENLGDDDLPYGMELTVYDAEGNKMETYPLDSDMGSLAPGKKVQGIEYHGVDAAGTIEIHFDPLLSFESATVFEVEIE